MYAWSPEDRSAAFVSDRESTGVFEAIGAHWWLSRFGHLAVGRRLVLMLDNEAVVRALLSGFSPRPRLMAQIRAIRAICVSLRIVFRCRHVLGVPFNSVADALSHNRWDAVVCLAVPLFDTPLLRSPVTSSLPPTLV